MIALAASSGSTPIKHSFPSFHLYSNLVLCFCWRSTNKKVPRAYEDHKTALIVIRAHIVVKAKQRCTIVTCPSNIAFLSIAIKSNDMSYSVVWQDMSCMDRVDVGILVNLLIYLLIPVYRISKFLMIMINCSSWNRVMKH